jgi:tRNA(fMet)-specific endonuclease VapC
VEFTRGI